MEENFITIHKYAALHRLSLHTVIKKTMSGELPSVEKEENGRKVVYVRYEKNAPALQQETPQEISEDIDYKKAYEDLHKEYLILKTKYQKMVEMLEG